MIPKDLPRIHQHLTLRTCYELLITFVNTNTLRICRINTRASLHLLRDHSGLLEYPALFRHVGHACWHLYIVRYIHHRGGYVCWICIFLWISHHKPVRLFWSIKFSVASRVSWRSCHMEFWITETWRDCWIWCWFTGDGWAIDKFHFMSAWSCVWILFYTMYLEFKYQVLRKDV